MFKEKEKVEMTAHQIYKAGRLVEIILAQKRDFTSTDIARIAGAEFPADKSLHLSAQYQILQLLERQEVIEVGDNKERRYVVARS